MNTWYDAYYKPEADPNGPKQVPAGGADATTVVGDSTKPCKTSVGTWTALNDANNDPITTKADCQTRCETLNQNAVLISTGDSSNSLQIVPNYLSNESSAWCGAWSWDSRTPDAGNDPGHGNTSKCL
jgi:hypothetical protein